MHNVCARLYINKPIKTRLPKLCGNALPIFTHANTSAHNVYLLFLAKHHNTQLFFCKENFNYIFLQRAYGVQLKISLETKYFLRSFCCYFYFIFLFLFLGVVFMLFSLILYYIGALFFFFFLISRRTMEREKPRKRESEREKK